nr:amp deaminase [Quercus suber]
MKSTEMSAPRSLFDSRKDWSAQIDSQVIRRDIKQIMDIRYSYTQVLSLSDPKNNLDDVDLSLQSEATEPEQKERTRSAFNGSGREANDSPDPGSASRIKPERLHLDPDDDRFSSSSWVRSTRVAYRLEDSGVYHLYETPMYESHRLRQLTSAIPNIFEYYRDLDSISKISSTPRARSFATKRLNYLEAEFNLHMVNNCYQEKQESWKARHRNFRDVWKVDTHVHHSACMTQEHLLNFVRHKLKTCPHEIVMFWEGRHLTLHEVFEDANLADLTVKTLNMRAHFDFFHRFDKFNLVYKPFESRSLRSIFFKTKNFLHGRYLAELTKEVISSLEAGKHDHAEWRISIYGDAPDEWDRLATWIVDHKIFSTHIRWLVQIPRIFSPGSTTTAHKIEHSFGDVIKNIFEPLFEVTRDPCTHPKLNIFLQHVVGFDSVDDESKTEYRHDGDTPLPLPKDWTMPQNPPYSYWIYYLYANISSLNMWRKHHELNTFVLRPHCGEAGDPDHLAVAVMCCHSISHGLVLDQTPVLQYVFYLEQIGIAMSPISNNILFRAFDRNPFPQFFRRGLNVSLSTDDPLHFAFTKEPLMEEYAVASRVYRLSDIDLCELAKNSIIQSGFEHVTKQHWLGDDYLLPGGMDGAKSNVPPIRQAFRHRIWLQERKFICSNRETACFGDG